MNHDSRYENDSTLQQRRKMGKEELRATRERTTTLIRHCLSPEEQEGGKSGKEGSRIWVRDGTIPYPGYQY